MFAGMPVQSGFCFAFGHGENNNLLLQNPIGEKENLE